MRQIRGAVVWFVTTLFVVYAFCLNTAAAVFSESIKTTLNASNLEVSIASGAFIFGFACMQIVAGYLFDTFNSKFVMSSGVFLLALGNVAISFSNNIYIYTFSNLIQGIGASFAFVGAAVLIAQWFSPKLFPLMFGLTQTLSCVLAGIIHYYFSLILATNSWNEIYQRMAIFGFILFLLTLLIVRSPSDYKTETKLSLRASLKIILYNKQIWLCSLAAATSFGVLLAYAGFWYMQVQTFYSVQTLQAIMISGFIFAGIGVGTPILGWLSNQFKSRTLVIHTTLCLGAMALILDLYLPHFNVNTLIGAKVIAFLTGFFISGSMLFYTMISEISTNTTRGVAISFLNTCVFLFNTLMLFIPYLFVTETSKTFFTNLWVLPFFILIAILLLYFIRETYSSR